MRTKNIFKAMAAGFIVLGLASCKSDDIEFPDYDEQTVYFAYQTPIRTMVLGMDDLGSTADNDTHACKIYSTMGGAYSGKKYKIKVDVAVENSLCDNLFFDLACTDKVEPMPTSYYQLSSTTIDYKGDEKGYVDVQLTDAFFNDPKSYQGKYVIPVVMKNQTGADRILTGQLQEGVSSANRFDADAWFIKPMDYVLYCVRYISKFEGFYLPQGTVETSYKSGTSAFSSSETKPYKYEAWERVPQGNAVNFKTRGVNSVSIPVVAAGGVNGDETFNGEVILNFSGNNCTATAGEGTWNGQKVQFTVSGNGTYTEKSPNYNWGQKDRDGLKLDFTAEWKTPDGSVETLSWKYDMALQRRGAGNTVEEFSVTLKK